MPAPWLHRFVPNKAGDRIKTDRRDVVIWRGRVPDAAHEAMRDLVRARATAIKALSKARQHLGGFLLFGPGRKIIESPVKNR
jgi:transposase